MDRLLYVAASGASQLMRAQAINANNLANAGTTGFQAELIGLRSQPVFGPGFGSRVYAMTESPGVDFSKGGFQHTGRELDVAVQGQGWIAVQAPDGTEAYTRAGNLRVTTTGLLETADGLPVLGDGGPILVPESEKIDIGADGTVSSLPVGQDPATMAVVGRIKLVSPDPAALRKGEDGLLRMADGSAAPPSASVRLATGMLETSNVSVVEAMMNMMELARQFEAQVDLLKAARDNDAASAKLMQLG